MRKKLCYPSDVNRRMDEDLNLRGSAGEEKGMEKAGREMKTGRNDDKCNG